MCWFEPFVKLRAPKMFNLRRDPFERADENSNTYWDWVISHAYLLYGMQALVAQQIEAFVQFPPRQKPAAFNLDAVLRQDPGVEPAVPDHSPVAREVDIHVFADSNNRRGKACSTGMAGYSHRQVIRKRHRYRRYSPQRGVRGAQAPEHRAATASGARCG